MFIYVFVKVMYYNERLIKYIKYVYIDEEKSLDI